MTERRAVVYLDTNVFIALVEGEGDVRERAFRVFDILRAKPGLSITSELTLAEVLAPPKSERKLRLEEKRVPYLDLLLRGGIVNLMPVDRETLMETAELRVDPSFRSMKLADAIHLVTAVRSGCSLFLTGDRDFRTLPRGIRRINYLEAPLDLGAMSASLA